MDTVPRAVAGGLLAEWTLGPLHEEEPQPIDALTAREVVRAATLAGHLELARKMEQIAAQLPLPH